MSMLKAPTLFPSYLIINSFYITESFFRCFSLIFRTLSTVKEINRLYLILKHIRFRYEVKYALLSIFIFMQVVEVDLGND